MPTVLFLMSHTDRGRMQVVLFGMLFSKQNPEVDNWKIQDAE